MVPFNLMESLSEISDENSKEDDIENKVVRYEEQLKIDVLSDSNSDETKKR